MENRSGETLDQKQIRRFVSYEEFLQTFYPASAGQETPAEEHDDDDFGANLAIESLNRHADTLKFGDA